MKIKINFNNIFKYLLVILYPLMISILLEYNICQNFYGTIKFLTSKPNILLFNILISTILFLLIILIFEKAADGKATKIIIPSEIQGIAGLVKSIKEVAVDDTQK